MINLDSIKLQNINKPARYVGSEVHQIIKNSNIKNSVVLCYLNVYEKAMSSYYINLIYNNLNMLDDVWCKRCFAPDLDFEEFLIKNKLELYSLEDFESVKKNDMLLFVVDNEIDLTNFFNILKLADISLDKQKRDEKSPKILLLPINSTNIEPIREYADYVFSFGSNKENIQKALNHIKFGDETSDKNIEIKHIENGIVPSIKINNSSIIIDFDFMDDIDQILQYIDKNVKARGVNKVSFLNYEKINEYKFCEYVYKIKANIDNVRITCKNIDFNRFQPDILDVLFPCMEHNAALFNVITCSEKLKSKINMGAEKGILLEKVQKVFKNNRNSIKLNFLIGLPEETYEDIDDIFELLDEIVTMYSQNKAKDKFSMKVNIDYYIPTEKDKIKACINNLTKLETKVRYVLEKQYDHCIKLELKDFNSYMTRLLLKNADKELSNYILEAYNLGARFNSDSKKYNKSAWDRALFNNMNLVNGKYNI